MMNPKDRVKKEFESKEKLVDKLTSKLTKQEGESSSDLKKRLMKVSNQKLLTLHAKAAK